MKRLFALILVLTSASSMAFAECTPANDRIAPHTRASWDQGGVVYDLTTNELLTCDGTNYQAVGSGSGSSSDRITSGTTTALVNSATTFISLTTGATTWGYISSGTSYLPTITAALVSSTRVSATTASVTELTVGGNVGIGTMAANAAALLDVSSSTKGFLPPRMTTTQRNAIASPPNGMMIYNSSSNTINVRENGAWAKYVTQDEKTIGSSVGLGTGATTILSNIDTRGVYMLVSSASCNTGSGSGSADISIGGTWYAAGSTCYGGSSETTSNLQTAILVMTGTQTAIIYSGGTMSVVTGFWNGTGRRSGGAASGSMRAVRLL